MNFVKPYKRICLIFLGLLSTLKCQSLESEDLNHLSSDREKVEALVKQWAPLVWLAPNEKYMPGDVSKFLEHVHAEEAKVVTVYPGSEITELDDLSNYDHGMTNELSYYDPVDQRQGRFRNKRNFKDSSISLDLLFDFPIGNESKNWYLVTNNDIEELITHKESFLHGQNPLTENVPIYAVVSMCKQSSSGSPRKPDISLPFLPPITTTAHPSTHPLHSTNNQENEVTYVAKDRLPYKRNPYAPTPKNIFELQPNLRQTINKVEKSIRLIRRKREVTEQTTVGGDPSDSTDVPSQLDSDAITVGRKATTDLDDGTGKQSINANMDESIENAPRSDENDEWETITERRHDTERYAQEVSHDYPHFHVTYWMFYPYSQGKVMCTIDLGPFGPWPIPLIFGMCLGTKKEFGSHVGDWEHMSLYFRGRKEPDEMYVSAHDAGAFYSYERLTGTFEYHSQETRKGILQQPTFPKTVVTSSNHPVLFAAEGSHGLWTAPGKHKFVRVPRLYDINGFGMPWSTWRNVQVIYENGVKGRSALQPKWMKFNGRWGNPKTKCHPLKRIGLHICELTDGPTGIPRKKHHFKCKA
uniref:Vacuolar protein sorting-associated protein 62 n=1 Tax=Anopheles dirus TaxID=7168 RepID=A0A182NQ18_9DIPT